MIPYILSLFLALAQPPFPYPDAYPPPITSVSGKIVKVDRFERTFRLEGQRRTVIGVFTTRYSIKNKAVSAREFWGHISTSDTVSLKVRAYPTFNVLTASNISIDK